MATKKCILCNKSYDYDDYNLFGRGCLNNLYELLSISKPKRGTKDKEMHLCNRIALKNFKFFLSRKKKYKLAEKYIALKYLEKINFNKYPYNLANTTKDIDYNSLLDEIKEKIAKDIKKISIFSKDIIESISIKLNDIYELFNDTQKFEEIIKKFQNLNSEELDEKVAEEFLKSLTFIFDEAKINSPIAYAVFYSMQYLFWEIVVIGGFLVDLKLSAALLQKSLVGFGQSEHENIEITDDEITNLVKQDEEFKSKIDKLIKECETDTIELKDYPVEFNGKDLLFSIHKATLNLKATKNEDNTWNLEIELRDTYDYTEFKNLKEYVTSNASIPKSIFSITLNNFAVVSSEYGVIKPYKFIMRFEINNYMEGKKIEK